MSKGNPFQDQINLTGFDERLKQGDSEAWGILLQYVRKQVETRSRSATLGFDRQEAVEENTSKACNHIAHELGNFQQRGLLSAYLDTLIRTATANQDVKRLMNATSRFLKAANKLPAPYQKELRVIVRRRPALEGGMILAFMDGQKFDWSDWRRKRLWYDARRGLLDDQDFKYLLHKLAREKHRQARTLLDWQNTLSTSERASQDSVETQTETALENIPDLSPTPFEELFRREDNQKLLDCLEELRQSSGDQHRAIIGRFYDDESNEHIATSLGASQVAVRKRVERGLKNLRECISEDQLNEGSDERNNL